MAALHCALLVPFLVAAFSASLIHAQQSVALSSGGGDFPPFVVVTWVGHGEPFSVSSTVDLLVLWRGSSDWYVRDVGKSLLEVGSSATSGGQADGSVHRVFVHDRALELQFDPQARTVLIQGHVIALHDANVLLLDEVDSAAGIKVAGVVRVEPQISNSGDVDPATAAARQSAQILDFLRCDASGLPADVQQKMALNCSRMKGR